MTLLRAGAGPREGNKITADLRQLGVHAPAPRMEASSRHPAAAWSGSRELSHSLPTKREPVAPSERAEHIHTRSGFMISAGSSLRPGAGGRLTSPLSQAPPGSSALTVTPLPSRSRAQI